MTTKTISSSPPQSPLLTTRRGILCLLGGIFLCLLCLFWSSSFCSSSSSSLPNLLRRHDDAHSFEIDIGIIVTTNRTNERYERLCRNSMNRTDNGAVGWEFAGPTTYINHWEDRRHTRLTSAAAVQQIVHSRNDTWFVASVNGGVWRSKNINEEDDAKNDEHHHDDNDDDDDTFRRSNVSWENVLDGQPVTCTSMSVLHVSKVNPSLIYAGCGGSTSSEQGWDHNVVNSGDWNGIMVSSDNGDTWEMIQGFPENYYVTDILEVTITRSSLKTPSSSSSLSSSSSSSSSSIKSSLSTTALLVSAQSNLWNKTDGGIWRSEDGGRTFERTCSVPTFTLTLVDTTTLPHLGRATGLTSASTITGLNSVILATHAHSTTHTASLSNDGGRSFVNIRLPWKAGAVPFYTCATQLSGGTVIIGGLTRLAGGLPNNTDSQIFVFDGTRDDVDITSKDVLPSSLSSSSSLSSFTLSPRSMQALSWKDLHQPMRLDNDSMPKDRMALLGDPIYEDLLYVAGNAEALAWRVNITTGEWTKLWDIPDIIDGSVPHGDCRNFAWDHSKDRLLLATDGGVFARVKPRSHGGFWLSLNGNYSALELISAHYDPRDDRYVVGAQDNCAIVTKKGGSPSDVGIGFVMGDGTVTMVDSDAVPSRLFGTTQFLGVGTIENDPQQDSTLADETDDDDEGCGGLCFAQGDKFIQVPLERYFPEPSSFPFFVHPYTLNRQDPTKLLFWVNGTESGIYQFDINYSVEDKDDIGPPSKIVSTPKGQMILDFISGGVINGKDNPNLIVAVSNTHLFFRSGGNHDHDLDIELSARPLPVSYALPVTLQYDSSAGKGSRILGPLTHARTVFMAAARRDSRTIAITGWTTIENNEGDESIFLTTDGGMHWQNITGNLREASGVSGKVRPSGLLLLHLPPSNASETQQRALAVLVGTSNGIYVTFPAFGMKPKDDDVTWSRFGTCEEFPIVLVADVDHEPITDRLVASTYGRGIFALRNATYKLQEEFVVHWQLST